jgi:hypothetical protein
MVNAGLVRLVVVDDHKAEFWAQIFPKIRCTRTWPSGPAGDRVGVPEGQPQARAPR